MPAMQFEELSDILQSTYCAVEGDVGSFSSSDSGVFSSDSEPSSPILLTPVSGTAAAALGPPPSQHFVQLPNASSHFSAYPEAEPLSADWYANLGSCGTFGGGGGGGDGGEWGEHTHPHFLTPPQDGDADYHLDDLTALASQLPVPTSSAASTDDGIPQWHETRAGFKICHTGDGKAQVKLNAHYTYDIDINIDIPKYIPTVVKTEKTSGYYGGELYPQYPAIDVNNNNNNYISDNNNNNTSNNINNNNNTCPHNNNNNSHNTIFSNHPEEGCNGCLHNRNYYESHYPVNHNGHPHERTDNSEGRVPSRRRQSVTRTERLWEFILRLLGETKSNPRLIQWVDRDDGTFRLNNSKAIALMWGMRKNNVQMTYEKLSRALRYYYHRQILEPVLGKKLVYRFGPNALQVWHGRVYRPQGSSP